MAGVFRFNLLFYRGNDWWRSKVAYVIGYVYLLVFAFAIPFATALPLILLIAATSIGFALLGYLLNDYFDRQTDARAGKQNLLIGLGTTTAWLLIAASAVLAIAPWLYLPFDNTSLGLLAAELLLFILYTAPVVRFKERAVLGLITDALYAHVIPSALIAYTVFKGGTVPPDVWFFALVLIWQFLVGVRNIIIHQVADAAADKASGVKSWVNTTRGTLPVNTVYTLRIAEAVLFMSLLAYIAWLQPTAVVLLAVALLYYALVLFIPDERKHAIEALAFTYFPNYLYEKVLPVIAAAMLLPVDVRYGLVLPAHLALFNYPEVKILAVKARLFAVRWYYIAKKGVVVPAWVFVKTMGNYFIYYFLRLFRIDLVKENLSAYGYFKKKLSPRLRH